MAALHKTARQILRRLQQFRDRLSDRAESVFGAPLRTIEVEIQIQEPRTPDVKIGWVFERNWRLLSPVLPMTLVKPLARRHFIRKIPEILYANISRTAAQWEQSVNSALANLNREAERRLDELWATVERLVQSADAGHVPEIQQDLERLAAARSGLK
jgi:hypothetical protein